MCIVAIITKFAIKYTIANTDTAECLHESSFLGLKLSGYLGLEWDWCLLLVWRGLCISIFKAISQQGFYLSGAPLQGLVIQKMQRTNKSLRTYTWTEQNSLVEMQEKEQNSEHIY